MTRGSTHCIWHRRLRLCLIWLSAAVALLGMAACKKQPEQMSPETQARLTALSQSLREVDLSLAQLGKQNEAIRAQQHKSAMDLSTLRSQGETLESDLSQLDISLNTNRQDIQRLNQRVSSLTNEMNSLATGEPIAQEESPSRDYMPWLFFMLIIILLLLAGLGFLFWMRHKRQRSLGNTSAASSSSVPLSPAEEQPAETQTEIGAIRFFGAARTEHEKQTQNIDVVSPQAPTPSDVSSSGEDAENTKADDSVPPPTV